MADRRQRRRQVVRQGHAPGPVEQHVLQEIVADATLDAGDSETVRMGVDQPRHQDLGAVADDFGLRVFRAQLGEGPRLADLLAANDHGAVVEPLPHPVFYAEQNMPSAENPGLRFTCHVDTFPSRTGGPAIRTALFYNTGGTG